MDLFVILQQEREPLLRYCRSLAKHAGDGEDLAQHALLKALENYDTLSQYGEPRVRAWLMRTARNAFIDNCRKQAKQVPAADTDLLPYEEDFSALHVSELLHSLPPNLRQMVTLRHLEGYTSQEIGALLNLPPATVRTRLRAAMMLLKEMYTKEMQL